MQTWHLYCSIVDNFGDIGICWRLSQHIVHERGDRVFLWIDDWPAAQTFLPFLSPEWPMPQCHHGVYVGPWSAVASVENPVGDVLIEAFACELPDHTRQMLAAGLHKPVWFNLEYLSAESWIDEFHGKSSYVPAVQAWRGFFFMSPRPLGGGLLRERMGLPEPANTDQVRPQRMLCFAYDHAPYRAWLNILDSLPGVIEVDVWGSYSHAALSVLKAKTQLTLKPFVAQSVFDDLLYTYDVLWLRGEDSVVRGLYTGRPFVWQLYPQEAPTRRQKLLAWLGMLYEACPCEEPIRAAYTQLHLEWNALEPWGAAWIYLLDDEWSSWQTWHMKLAHYFRAQSSLMERLETWISQQAVQFSNLPEHPAIKKEKF
jgi:uncharacterized repeat protein (TIGR03837 family)